MSTPRSSLLRLAAAALLGVAAAVLIACGGSGKGLIPTQNAGPLQSDFDAVAQAAQTGDGSCTATATAIRKTEQDFDALPATIDQGLHSRLSQGIENLRARALVLCAQPLPSATISTGAPTDTSTDTTGTTDTSTQITQTDTTTVTSTTPTTTAPPTPGGGTPAPGDGGAGAGAGGPDTGAGNTPGAAGGATPGNGAGGGGGGADGGGGQ
ncbi:MAG TPA: hypothetical protein VLJ42_01600 [Solirubrobacteraceae bacterium]|nr:hypothetical protein [Solirubrobacteraceae bacterium]